MAMTRAFFFFFHETINFAYKCFILYELNYRASALKHSLIIMPLNDVISIAINDVNLLFCCFYSSSHVVVASFEVDLSSPFGIAALEYLWISHFL